MNIERDYFFAENTSWAFSLVLFGSISPLPKSGQGLSLMHIRVCMFGPFHR
jgi:hypothetical protein